MPTYLLGIDVSTTATKALLIAEDGAVVAVAATEYPFETPRPLWSEQDAALFWDGAVKSIRAVLAKSGVVAADIAGVGLTGQMHGLCALDGAGEPLRPCIIWNDQRTGEQCAEITRRVGAGRACSSSPATPSSPASPHPSSCGLRSTSRKCIVASRISCCPRITLVSG